MNYADKEYFELSKKVLKEGIKKGDRTGTGTLSIFGDQRRYDLSKGFPLLTTKKVNYAAVLHELIWFIQGDTNIKYLVENNVNIWNAWPYEEYTKSPEYNGETEKEFIEKIKSSDEFAKKWGELGPVYGKQWRDFGGVDQLMKVVEQIKNNPNSRRLIVSAWNPTEVDNMLLPPCHSFFQFYVVEGKLSAQLYQRSGDIFLGVPFNIASYATLIHMIAYISNLKVGEFIHTIGDAHIYLNHVEQINEQLSRSDFKLPTFKIKRKVESLFDFKFDDIEIEGYEHHPWIKAPVAV